MPPCNCPWRSTTADAVETTRWGCCSQHASGRSCTCAASLHPPLPPPPRPRSTEDMRRVAPSYKRGHEAWQHTKDNSERYLEISKPCQDNATAVLASPPARLLLCPSHGLTDPRPSIPSLPGGDGSPRSPGQGPGAGRPTPQHLRVEAGPKAGTNDSPAFPLAHPDIKPVALRCIPTPHSHTAWLITSA